MGAAAISTSSGRRLPWRSVLVGLILAAQGSTFITGSVAWPFLAYCMYAPQGPDIPTTTHRELWATLADGRDIELKHKDLGYGYWVLWDVALPAIREHRDAAALDRLLTSIEGAHGSPAVSVRIESLRVRIIDGEFENTPGSAAVYPLPAEGTGAAPTGGGDA